MSKRSCVLASLTAIILVLFHVSWSFSVISALIVGGVLAYQDAKDEGLI